MPRNADTMEADPISFGGLFDQYTFVIPEFQRDFEWEGDKVAQFYIDIKEESGKDTQYFFGPIVLVSPAGFNQQQIIDGQQRITCASIFIAVIADILFSTEEHGMEAVAEGYYRRIANFGTNWQPKLTPSSDYVLFFSKLLQMDSPANKIAARSADAIREIEKNMLDAYKIFHGKLKEDFADDKGIWNTGKLIDLFNSFQSLDRFALLKIRVPNNRSAWQIFINLNKKGQDLQISDLVKAVLSSRNALILLLSI